MKTLIALVAVALFSIPAYAECEHPAEVGEDGEKIEFLGRLLEPTKDADLIVVMKNDTSWSIYSAKADSEGQPVFETMCVLYYGLNVSP